MTTRWAAAPLSVVRSVIASAAAPDVVIPERLGDITLRAHQRRAAERLASIIAERGGAMLADPVGVGKTYTALAVAARAASDGVVLVVAPASLRTMWREAAQRAGIDVTITTYESLSRGVVPDLTPDFIIADEAHRLRSPAAQRYALLASLARRTRVLLVTATPVNNTRGDLSAQVAIFLGRVAWQLSDEALTEYIVRGTGAEAGARPRLDGPHRVSLDIDDDCLDQLLALPAPVPARDEGVAATLVTFGLVHQWTSSRAALVAALRKRRAHGFALVAALESGRRPTRSELAAWTHAGDVVQLAFPEIVTGNSSVEAGDAALLAAVNRHNAAIASLLAHLRASPDPDDARASALLQLRRAHPGARIIAFCQYTETVAALRSRLSREPGIAALTASGARVAGGPIARDAVLAQFMPAESPPAGGRRRSERIDLLITTDLLSEGLNLQEASVIVHLDLPWNPARLDQRVGRALRLGSRHGTVTVYSVAPPSSAERLLRIETRLREKLRVAQRTVGVAGTILPTGGTDARPESGFAEQRSAFTTILDEWRASVDERSTGVSEFAHDASACLIASIAGIRRGFLAVVRTPGGPLLVADVGRGPQTGISTIATAIAIAGSFEEAAVHPVRASEALHSLARWLSSRRAAATIDLGLITAGRARRAALARVAQALARAPRHRRSNLAALADSARAVASAPLAEGAERVLETLVGAPMSDEAWLRAIAAFGALNSRPSPRLGPTDSHAPGDPLAIILFEPGKALQLAPGSGDTLPAE